MRTFIGATSLGLALSPWILPSIAVAAKLTRAEARNACRGAFAHSRPGDDGNATGGQARNQQTLPGCIEAKLAGKTWPPQ
jgi:hypothetical protein